MDLLRNNISVEAEFIDQVKKKMLVYVEESTHGYLREMCMAHLNTPGKFFRSRALFRLGSFYEVPKESLIELACSCEFLHEASLVHDDIQDGDQCRRGAPSTWSIFGQAQAINVGDFFLMLSFLPLTELGSFLVKLHSKASMSLVLGQANELVLNDFNLPKGNYFDAYLDCVKNKTGSLFSYLASSVAYLAKLDELKLKFLDKIYGDLGVVFQIQDDLLDLYCDKKRLLQGSDIQEGKLSVLVAICLDFSEEEKATILKKILKKDRELTSVEDIAQIKELFLKEDVLEKSLLIMNQRILDLLSELDRKEEYKLKELVSADIDQLLKPVQSLLER